MNISNYHLGDVYRDKVLLREYNSPVEDIKNSSQFSGSFSGPGHGKTTGATDTSPNNFDSKVMFPKDQEISNEDKKNLLIEFLRDEIDNGKFNQETKNKFGELLDHLLSTNSAEEVEKKKKK
jgi:hypothetical protein